MTTTTASKIIPAQTSLNEADLLFCDVEVFKHNAFIVFKDITGAEVAVYHNKFDGMTETIQGKTLVGYNINYYDIHIINAMLELQTPEQIKRLNDRIIIHGEKLRNDYGIPTLDCFQQIHISMPSLKKIEGNIGRMILESEVDFTIERALTPAEYQEALDYCRYDVDMTIEVYKKRVHNYFEPKMSLVNRLGKESAINWNTTTISANLLTPKPIPKWSSLRLHRYAMANRDEKNMAMFKHVPEAVQEHWLDKVENNFSGEYKGNISIEKFGCDIEFGFGGLHGVSKHYKDVTDVKLLDVASMYPHIILNINALDSASGIYQDMLLERIDIKHKDRVLSDALKLVLNSVYGNLKNKYSILFDPLKSVSVCIYGQIALYALCERLSETCNIININTDGVAFTTESDDYIDIWKQWEKDFVLTLEEDNYDRFIQKNVNNYIAVEGDDITVKGGDVSRYHYDADFANNNARIIDIAIVDYLLYGVDPLNTIQKHADNPLLFQYILQAGRTYQGTIDDDKNEYQKINRVFATNKDDSICLYKHRHDGGLVRFPNTPQKMFLWNDEISKLENFADIVDLSHYYNIIVEKLEQWNVTI